MSSSNSRERTSLPKKILFSLMPCLLVLLLIESWLRIFPFHEDSGRTRSGFVIKDKDLGWRLKPSKKGALGTNEIGFRDTSFNQNADKTVLLLGDSVSWGDGIASIKHIYPYLLERILSESTNQAYEVVNSSVPGYSTFQQLRYLQLYGLDLLPDMIILQFCLNDVVERYTALAQYGGDNVFLGVDTRELIPGFNGWLIRNSRAFEALARLLMKSARDQQEYDVRKLASDQLSDELESAWALALSEIDDINRTAMDNNIPLMIIIAPYRFQLDRPQRTNQPQKVLLKHCSDNGIPVVDLLPVFASFHGENVGVPLFNDANHFSMHGHSLAARILAKSILSVFNERIPGPMEITSGESH